MKTNKFIDKNKDKFDKAIEHFKSEIKQIRTGRANSSIVENILVSAYGVKTPLMQLASISIPDPKTIVIEPWDKGIIKDIEKGIIESRIGLNPINEGKLVRISIPSLTEETRKDLIKLLNEKSEKAKVAVRGVRDEVRDEIITAEKDKAITEDDKYDFQKDLDEYIKEINEQIKKIGEDKETEIMTI